MENNHNPLWQFSLKAYGQEKLAEKCLFLQDEYKLDVNLILLFIWAGFSGAKLTDDSLSHIIRHAQAWQQTAVVPLRQLRKNLKADVGAVDTQRSGDFREKVKALELEAEHLQQDMLMDLLLTSPAMNARDGERKSVARRNLLGYLQHQGIKPVAGIKSAFEEILSLGEKAFLSIELAENENQDM